MQGAHGLRLDKYCDNACATAKLIELQVTGSASEDVNVPARRCCLQK